MNEQYAEFTYAGSLQLEKILVKLSAIDCVQKPKSDSFGCIIQVNQDKLPIKEKYDEVKYLLAGKAN